MLSLSTIHIPAPAPVEEEEEVLEGLRNEVAVHAIVQLPRAHVAKARVPARHLAFLQRAKQVRSRPKVPRRARGLEQGQRALCHLGSQRTVSSVVQQPLFMRAVSLG